MNIYEKLEGNIANLYKAIKNHYPLEDEDIVNAGVYGASGGFGGFTYYMDTVVFYDNNEKKIWGLLYAHAEPFENVFEFIASFVGAENVQDGDQFKNLLAWFALEEVGKEIERIKKKEKE